MLGTSWVDITAWGFTWQNAASLLRVSSLSGFEERHTRMSGVMPRPRNSFTVCCVGFVFCSPTGPMTGTKETWTKVTFSRPTRN